MDQQRLRDKIEKIEALFAGTTYEGRTPCGRAGARAVAGPVGERENERPGDRTQVHPARSVLEETPHRPAATIRAGTLPLPRPEIHDAQCQMPQAFHERRHLAGIRGVGYDAHGTPERRGRPDYRGTYPRIG